MSKTGRTPTIAHFSCYIRTLLHNKDLVGAIESLQEMESMGLFFQPSGDCSSSGGPLYHCALGQMESIKAGLLAVLMEQSSAASLEELYFILAEQVSQKKNVPRIVLDVLVEAIARFDMMDRCFAVFEDYQKVFNTVPDIHSYNSLLRAVATARIINMRTLLAVFQEIETPSALNNMTALKPNESSFSILLNAIADEGNFQSLFDILAYMSELNVNPSTQSLRRLLISLAKAYNWNGYEVVKKLLIRVQDGRDLPVFLKLRVSQLRKKQEAEQKAKRDSWEASGAAVRATFSGQSKQSAAKVVTDASNYSNADM